MGYSKDFRFAAGRQVFPMQTAAIFLTQLKHYFFLYNLIFQDEKKRKQYACG
jgi:hypothetical protein